MHFLTHWPLSIFLIVFDLDLLGRRSNHDTMILLNNLLLDLGGLRQIALERLRLDLLHVLQVARSGGRAVIFRPAAGGVNWPRI